MATDLSFLRSLLAADPGLSAHVAAPDLAEGLAAVASLTALLEQGIDAAHLNDDGEISASDILALNAAIRSDASLLAAFSTAHGDATSGFDLLQGMGGDLMFQGRGLVDKVAHAILDIGAPITDGRILSEDGAAGRPVDAVAGWLNYFVNAVNIVQCSDGDDRMVSRDYSAALSSAADELWRAGAGNDLIAAREGDDTILGEAGNDSLFGETGDDVLNGGDGADRLVAGEGSDQLYGGSGLDRLDGDAGDDLLDGGQGADQLRGAEGSDTLQGGGGADQIFAGEGADRVEAGDGADKISLVEALQATDTLVFAPGHGGATPGTADKVTGFVSGIDKIDLQAFGPMTLESAGLSGSGASCHYDGHVLRIDGSGDGLCDLMVIFKDTAQLVSGDFLFG